MAPPLPLEVIERVVDAVGNDPSSKRTQDLLSLSLCTKGLVTRCQVHLYHDVSVFSMDNFLLEAHPSLNKTVLFAKTIVAQPHLALHVRVLRCVLLDMHLGGDCESMDILADVISKMDNVRTVALRYQLSPTNLGPPVPPFGFPFTMLSTKFKDSLSFVVQNGKLQGYHLSNVFGVPRQLVPAQARVPAVTIFNSTIETNEDAHWLTATSLAISVTNERWTNVDSRPTLGAFRGLKDLAINVETSQSHVWKWNGDFRCPLLFFDTSALANVTHLSIHLVTTIEDSDVEIARPFGWKWGPIWRRLPALEVLNLHTTYQGHLGQHSVGDGLQWCHLPLSLAGYAAPALKQIVMTVNVRGREARSGSNRDFASAVNMSYVQFTRPMMDRLRMEGRDIAFIFRCANLGGDSYRMTRPP